MLSQTPKFEFKPEPKPLFQLPIPPLNQTAQRYLNSLRPLLSKTEYQASSKSVTEFIDPNGLGPILQSRLHSHSHSLTTTSHHQQPNWLSPFWDAEYLQSRAPLIPSTSFFGSHNNDFSHLRLSFLAAVVAKAVLEFRRMVLDSGGESLVGEEGWCGGRYKFLFDSCRVPGVGGDGFVRLGGEEWEMEEYFVVMRKGGFWMVGFEDFEGEVLGVERLEEMLRVVYGREQDEEEEEGVGIGILTSEERNSWAQTYNNLSTHPLNRTTLCTIQNSAFIINLDAGLPTTSAQLAQQYFFGGTTDFTNRWYDKPVQMVVTDNSRLGFVGEHSMIDGGQCLRLNIFVHEFVLGYISQEEPFTQSPPIQLPQEERPVRLRFICTPQISRAISTATSNILKRTSEIDLHVLQYESYGSTYIKQANLSPDAYVQILIQLASFKINNGVVKPIYQPVSTRMFRDGRTEGVRSVGIESIAFCEAMTSLQLKGGNSKIDAEICRKLLIQAIEAHSQKCAEARRGVGFERHLFGLRKMFDELKEIDVGHEKLHVPSIFEDKAWDESQRWHISTSGIKIEKGKEWCDGSGFCWVEEGGWGVAYFLGEGRMQFTVTSKGLGSKRFCGLLEESANELRELLIGGFSSML